MRYAELHCKTNFSFLEGASHADELVERAIELGYSGLAITDRNSVAGVVRAHTAAKEQQQMELLIGAELQTMDGPPIVVWAMNRVGYASLCRLITRGRRRREKGACDLSWRDIAKDNEGLLAGLLLRHPTLDAYTLKGTLASTDEPLHRIGRMVFQFQLSTLIHNKIAVG